MRSEEGSSGKISDRNFYGQTGYAIQRCMLDIYNQNVAGRTGGQQNTTAQGPLGGTVKIIGTAGYNSTHGLTTVDLIFELDDVRATSSTDDSSGNPCKADVSLTGRVTYKGESRTIDQSGDISLNASGGKTSIDIFGNALSW